MVVVACHCESRAIDAMIVPWFAREVVDAHRVDADCYPWLRRLRDGRRGLVCRRANVAPEGNAGRHATLDTRNRDLGDISAPIFHRRSPSSPARR